MSSLFDLKTSASQLPSVNQGCAKFQYNEVSSTAPETGDNFPSAPKRYRWDVSGTTWWVPSKSYFRLRATYTANTGAQPTVANDIAINMGLCANLFQSMTFKMNSKVVCRIEDNVPQVDALHTRLSKSKSWLDTVGASTNFWQPKFVQRQNLIVSNPPIDLEDPQTYVSTLLQGYPGSGLTNVSTLEWTNIGAAEFKVAINATNTWLRVGDVLRFNLTATAPGARGVAVIVTAVAANGTFTIKAWDNTPLTAVAAAQLDAAALGVSTAVLLRPTAGRNVMEACWQPPLSIFQYPGALPACQFELELSPQTADLYMKAAIESALGNIAQAAATLKFNVDSLRFYAATIEGPRADNITYYMSLDEINVQPVGVDPGTAVQKKQFDVAPSTYALTVAFQNQGIIQDTRKSASKLKFTGANNTELSLVELYVQAFGMTLPSPYLDPLYDNSSDRLTRMYMDNMVANGALYDNGGGESKDDWVNRGIYYYLPTPKDGASESSRVYVNYKFSGAAVAGEANVLLFSHYKKMIAVSVVGGQTTSVLEADQ